MLAARLRRLATDTRRPGRKQREAYRARATQVVAAVRKFDAQDDHRALLARHVIEHLTRVEGWRNVLRHALLAVAEGFEANGDEYEKTGASDPGRQLWSSHTRATVW
jgi:hypothetical protein